MKSLKSRIYNLYIALIENLNKEECTVFCILGDIVDQGDASSYEKAIELLIYIKEVFTDYDPKFEFTPGNHDLCGCPLSSIPPICKKQKCKIDKYNEFINKVSPNQNFDSNLLYSEYDDIGIILASSVFHGNCKYGLIDIEALSNIDIKKPSVLVTHHAFFSVGKDDSSAIRNAYEILNVIEEKNIICVLHGHTHGYMNITIGEKCQVVGVSPFFKPIPNINNQANLIIINESGIHKIINYSYKEDFNHQYDCKDVFEKKTFSYKSSDIGKAYKNIILDTLKYGVLPNMHLNLCMPLKNFNDQIEQIFPDQIPVAELWQETSDVPESLYYNHGKYMKSKDKTAMDFVEQELNSKATSNRAIIPLIKFKDVIKSGDSFLPSFDLVQFGFCDDVKRTLFVTLYLRALEVKHFLKINLCEIYLMCKQITESIRSVETVDITILAFKAQYKDKYGCFKKAEIDKISEAKITHSLDNNDFESVKKWLEEKKDFNETVVKSKGIKSFCNALHEIDKNKKIKQDILEISDSILSKMMDLKKERKKNSNYKSIEKIEYDLNKLFDKIINLLQVDGFFDYEKKL
jgi:hypothetical protein